VDLYFQITGSGTGYTFGTVNLGLLASGANAYINLDQFASRAKPSTGDLPNGEKEENITLILKAYTDSGYTTLKWTFQRVVTVHWINSADPAFTVDELDNFDDGTVDGWAVSNVSGNDAGYPHIAVATDYVLSVPYSCKMTSQYTPGNPYTSVIADLYKSFTTPNKTKVYAIIDCRTSHGATANATYVRNKLLQIKFGSTVLTTLGNINFALSTLVDQFPPNKWLRIVVPLTPNITQQLTLEYTYMQNVGGGAVSYGYVWIDDFKLISK
jgi:hypothetical protein